MHFKKIVIVSSGCSVAVNPNSFNASVKLQDLYKLSSTFDELLTGLGHMPKVLDEDIRQSIEEWQTLAEAVDEQRDQVSDLQLQAVINKGRVLEVTSLYSTLGTDDETLETTSFPIVARGSQERASVVDKPVRGDDRFINYGCYCTPSQEAYQQEDWFGTGQPVDKIDALCHDLFQGYQCLKSDHGSQCDSSRSYSWTIGEDGIPTCADLSGSCAGDLCRLDLAFTAELYQLRQSWRGKYHKQNGFDRTEKCGVDPKNYNFQLNSESDDSRSVPQNSETKLTCCGTGLRRHLFHSDRQECCTDGNSKPIGTC